MLSPIRLSPFVLLLELFPFLAGINLVSILSVSYDSDGLNGIAFLNSVKGHPIKVWVTCLFGLVGNTALGQSDQVGNASWCLFTCQVNHNVPVTGS